MSATPIRSRDAIRLVAVREITTRVRARSFRVALLITVGAVVLGIVAPKLLGSSSAPYDVALAPGASNAARAAIEAAADAVGRDVRVTEVADAAALRAGLRDGDLDLGFDGDTLYVQRVAAGDDTGTFQRFLASTRSTLSLYAGLFEQGLSSTQAQQALAHDPLPVEGVLAPREDRTREKAITGVGIIMLFIFIQQYGSWVLNGIVEEKASRVVEVLLSVVRPQELLVGKTIGIGVVALAHGLIVAATALATAAAVGSSVAQLGGTAMILGLVGWFLLGYALYCLLMAMAGSLVSRQEEAQNAAFPFTMPLLIAYVVSVSTVWGDSTPPIVTVLSFVPLTAPVSMPARFAAGGVPVTEVVVSVALMLVSIVVVARIASSIYERAVLQSSRVRWRDVLGLR